MSPESEVKVETPEHSITTEKLKAGVHSYLKQNAEKVSQGQRHKKVYNVFIQTLDFSEREV